MFLLRSPANQFDSEEDESLLQASERFEKDALRFYPDRPCVTTVIDLAGKTIFITRYIRPLNPPKEFLDGVASNAQEVSLAGRVNMCNLSRCSVTTSSHCSHTGYGCPVRVSHPFPARQSLVFSLL